MKVGVVGHVEWVDFVRVARLPEQGQIIHAEEVWAEAAGGGAVAAVELMRLAGAATLYTALGNDDIGRRAYAELEALAAPARTHVSRRRRRADDHAAQPQARRRPDRPASLGRARRLRRHLLHRRRAGSAPGRALGWNPRRHCARAGHAEGCACAARRDRVERDRRGGDVPARRPRPGAGRHRADARRRGWDVRASGRRAPYIRGRAAARAPGRCLWLGRLFRRRADVWPRGGPTRRESACPRLGTGRHCRHETRSLRWHTGVAKWGIVG